MESNETLRNSFAQETKESLDLSRSTAFYESLVHRQISKKFMVKPINISFLQCTSIYGTSLMQNRALKSEV